MAECNSDKATVGSVVRTVYTDGTPYKPCVLCQTGLMLGKICATFRAGIHTIGIVYQILNMALFNKVFTYSKQS